MLGPTIRRAEGLRAAATPSGSLFPSPGRAGQLRRRGRIQNHRSESKGRVRIRNVLEDDNSFGHGDDCLANNIARVKE